jgi:hypothetical protein
MVISANQRFHVFILLPLKDILQQAGIPWVYFFCQDPHGIIRYFEANWRNARLSHKGRHMGDLKARQKKRYE